MKILVAIVMGFFSGLLINFMFVAVRSDLASDEASSAIFFIVTFFGGWALSAWALQSGARSVSKVFSRGFLLGTAEWLVMIFVGFVFSASTLTSTSSDAEKSGAA